MSKVSFDNSKQVFFQSLKQSVDGYFRHTGYRKTGDWRLYHKAVILFPMAIGIYFSLLFVTMPGWLGLLLCALLGLVISSIGFNIMHDACHSSYSRKKWVNDLLGLSLNALGGNAFFWKQKHNILHHTYTNIAGLDDDIAQSKLLRQSPTQHWMPVHRYQHLYLPVVYSLTLIVWAMVRDYMKYFGKHINNTPIQPMNRKEHITFWVSKLFYVSVYIVIPILCVGVLPWLAGYLTMNLLAGIVLSYTFQLAHAVEGPEFDAVGMDPKRIETEWAVHQIRTTANFSMHNKVISWFVGGLNFQVEHHLFPRISHIHYPALSKIVQEQCRRFQLPYHSFPTLRQAIASHVRTMKHMGQRPDVKQDRELASAA